MFHHVLMHQATQVADSSDHDLQGAAGLARGGCCDVRRGTGDMGDTGTRGTRGNGDKADQRTVAQRPKGLGMSKIRPRKRLM